MTNAAFKLEDSGFTREQVDALSDFMDGTVVTKADIATLSGEMKTEFENVRGDMNTKFERLEGKIIGLDGKINLVYWMLGVLITVNIGVAIKLIFA